MKLFKYGLPFAALAILASCSNDNLGEPNNNPPVESDPDAAYVNISIALSGVGTRAVSEYAEGETEEYTVKDATLYIFNSNTEKTQATNLLCEIPIDQYFATKKEGDEITQSHEIRKIKLDASMSKDGTYWALAVINKGTLKEPTTSQTFDDWIKVAQETDMRFGEYFTMTNALGWVYADDAVVNAGSAPTWLTKIDGTNIYYDTDANATHEDVNIYVQRGVAKVSLDENSKIKVGTKTDLKGAPVATPDEENPVDEIVLTHWWLDVTSNKTFPVQMYQDPQKTAAKDWYENEEAGMSFTSWASTDWKDEVARFLGGEKFRRVFWAVDPHYDGYTASSDFTTHTSMPTTANTKHDALAYCRENTFSVAKMLQDASTRLVFKGYYYVGGVTSSESDATLTTVKKGNDFISFGGKAVAIPSDLTVKSTQTSGEVSLPNLFDEIKVNGSYKASYVKLANDLNLSETTTETVNFHKDGEVYYTIILRHFDDTDLGLKNAGEKLGSTLSYSEDSGLTLLAKNYPTTIDNYLLGRYGLVRNNWYEISINKVNGPGKPTIPTPTPTPDDDPANLVMDVQIHILGWAKRKFQHDL